MKISVSLEIGLTPATLKVVRELITKGEQIMSALEDLQATVARVEANTSAAIAEVQSDVTGLQTTIAELRALLENNPDHAALQEALAKIDTLEAGVTSQNTKLVAVADALASLNPVP